MDSAPKLTADMLLEKQRQVEDRKAQVYIPELHVHNVTLQ